MSYTVTEATVVFPDKKAASSFSSGYASKKPCAHIDCELEGGFERSIWIPVRVARLYVKNRPDLPCDWDNFRKAVQLIERKCALTMVTEMLSRRDLSPARNRFRRRARYRVSLFRREPLLLVLYRGAQAARLGTAQNRDRAQAPSCRAR